MDGSRLKVLYISRGYTTHDHRFLTSFAKADWAPTHVPLLDETLEMRPLPEGCREVRSLADSSMDGATWRERRDHLARIISDIRPEVVIAGPIQSGTLLATLARARPLIAVSWGTDLLVEAEATSWSRFVTRHSLAASDAVFGDCLAVREAVRRNSGIADDRIVTFPWGIDLLSFSPAPSSLSIREELGWAANEVFISTRSWEPVYAIDVLIRAFDSVVRSRPTARLFLMGDGSLEKEIKSLVAHLGLGQFIHMTGRVNYGLLPDYFRAADAYVSSALSDGTSVSMLEAMACGLPVIVSDSFGNLEWVEEGVHGLLARPGDADSLAAAMLGLLESRRNRSAMGATNVETARNRANWDVNFSALAGLVEDVISTDRRG